MRLLMAILAALVGHTLCFATGIDFKRNYAAKPSLIKERSRRSQVSSSSLCGIVYNDINSNNKPDSHEGLGGVPVTVVNASGRTIVTLTTDANGHYCCNDLKSGVYRVVVAIVPVPLVPRENPDGKPEMAYLASLGPNQNLDDINFSFEHPSGAGDVCFIRGKIYRLANGNENTSRGSGIPSVPVTLISSITGTVVAQVTTDVTGDYSLFGPPGNYMIVVGTNGAVDGQNPKAETDHWPDGKSLVSLALHTVVWLNFAYGPIEPQASPAISTDTPMPSYGSLSGFVFLDKNKDGESQSGEGLPNIQVILKDFDDVVVNTCITDKDGAYQLLGTTPGRYHIQPLLPPGVVLSNSLGSGKPERLEVSVAAGTSSKLDLACLPVEPSGHTVSGKFFNDLNGNGIADAGEELADSLVLLRDRDGIIVNTALTDASGEYVFTDVDAGQYVVLPLMPSNFEAAPTANRPAEGQAAIIVPETSNNDVNFAFKISQPVSPISTTTATDTELTIMPEPSETSVSTSTIPEATTSGMPVPIQGNIYHDKNNDLDMNDGEGLSGISVLLRDSSGTTLQEVTTSESGRYEFSPVPDGTYAIVPMVPEIYKPALGLNKTKVGATITVFGNSENVVNFALVLKNQGLITEEPEQLYSAATNDSSVAHTATTTDSTMDELSPSTSQLLSNATVDGSAEPTESPKESVASSFSPELRQSLPEPTPLPNELAANAQETQERVSAREVMPSQAATTVSLSFDVGQSESSVQVTPVNDNKGAVPSATHARTIVRQASYRVLPGSDWTTSFNVGSLNNNDISFKPSATGQTIDHTVEFSAPPKA